MPLSSGTFTRDYDYTADRDAGDPTNKISATKVDADFDQIAAALSLALYRDGQAAATANIPMGGFKFTGLATSASARTDSVSAGIVQDGKLNWVDGGGTADAITATYSPAITALVDGQLCCVRATAANATTTPTFAPNGLTARTIVKQGGTALLAGDIHGDGHELILRYDLTNTRWELLNPHSVTLPNGSASLPSISFDGDADTGIYFDGTLPRMCFGGSNVAWWNATSFNPSICRVGDGSVSLPALAFAADTDNGFYRTGANAWSAATGGAQSFGLTTTAMTMGSGIDLILDSDQPDSVYSAGFRGAPVIDGNSAYAFPLADSGKTIYHNEAGTRTWTIPANASVAHPIGTVFILDNTGNSGSAGTITLAITSDTLRRGDGTAGTGSRTIAASQVAVIRKVASTEWIITGSFS